LLFGQSAIVRTEKKKIHAFPFKTRITKGLQEDKSVLQLDYDLEENPKQVREIVDELVDIGNNMYLGKAYTKKHGTPRLIAFFSLKKTSLQ
jgi:hypothetical protein